MRIVHREPRKVFSQRQRKALRKKGKLIDHGDMGVATPQRVTLSREIARKEMKSSTKDDDMLMTPVGNAKRRRFFR